MITKITECIKITEDCGCWAVFEDDLSSLWISINHCDSHKHFWEGSAEVGRILWNVAKQEFAKRKEQQRKKKALMKDILELVKQPGD